MGVRRGLAMVEIPIVAVIPGTLTWVGVPRFTNAWSEATAGDIKVPLRTLQNATGLSMTCRDDRHPIPRSPMSGRRWRVLMSAGFLKADPVNPAVTGMAATNSRRAATTAGTAPPAPGSGHGRCPTA